MVKDYLNKIDLLKGFVEVYGISYYIAERSLRIKNGESFEQGGKGNN